MLSMEYTVGYHVWAAYLCLFMNPLILRHISCIPKKEDIPKIHQAPVSPGLIDGKADQAYCATINFTETTTLKCSPHP